MDTPILDFAAHYAASGALRLHMPGHKGQGPGRGGPGHHGNTRCGQPVPGPGHHPPQRGKRRALFGAHTFFSAEGSSLCIRAMVALARQRALAQGRPPLLLAGRNATAAFLSAACAAGRGGGLGGAASGGSYLSCPLDGPGLEARLAAMDPAPTALYLTSPDYLGHTLPLRTSPRCAGGGGFCCWWITPTARTSNFCPGPAIPWTWGPTCAAIRPTRPCPPSPAGPICTSPARPGGAGGGGAPGPGPVRLHQSILPDSPISGRG